MNFNLKRTIIAYLKNAGFKDNDYLLDDDDKNFSEVFFTSYDAIDYIIKDIEKTDYSNILEIKRYKYRNGNITAIITFREDDETTT